MFHLFKDGSSSSAKDAPFRLEIVKTWDKIILSVVVQRCNFYLLNQCNE